MLLLLPMWYIDFFFSPLDQDLSNGHGIVAALVGGCTDFVVLAVVFLWGTDITYYQGSSASVDQAAGDQRWSVLSV